MKPIKKLAAQPQTEEREEQQPVLNGAQATQAGWEFATPEAMLRHDALHTPVPPEIGRRLEASLRDCPAPVRPWWKRWFGA